MRVEDISHVLFRAPDLPKMAKFLGDFGLIAHNIDGRLYARGHGKSPYLHITEPGDAGFAGLGFRAGSLADLRALGATTGHVPVALNRPGGGFALVLRDPDGVTIEVVAGQDLPDPIDLPPADGWNSAQSRSRVSRFKRNASSSHVVRLGHTVLSVTNFRRSEAWYKQHFGFLTSDEIEDQSGAAIGAFLRCDRGDTPTDHHTLALVEGVGDIVFNHAAFEVADLDDLLAGHRRLANAGWVPHWGVGRHLIGSQVFDYWFDPWGHKLEHWTDGDLLTRNDGSRTASLEELHATQWGSAEPRASASDTSFPIRH